MQEITENVISLHKEKNWRAIVDKYHDHPDRNKLLWVYPSEDNFRFLNECVRELGCDSIVSVGCGSGLLEWLITEATGIPVIGIEIDGAWWRCRYAPPTFIPLLLTTPTLTNDVTSVMSTARSSALLFCYFNSGQAFKDYLKHYCGNVLIIIGPEGKGVHTDPRPFGDVGEPWILFQSQEVRNSKDFIAIYFKQ